MLALAGAAALGVAGAIAFMAPASAHPVSVQGAALCTNEPGKAVIHWTVKNLWSAKLTITSVSVENGVGDIHMGATLDATAHGTQPTKSLEGDQSVSGKGKGTLTVSGTFEGSEKTYTFDSEPVPFDTDYCKASTSFTPNCDGSGTVTLHNGFGVKFDFFVTVGDGEKEKIEVAKNSDATKAVKAGFGQVAVWWLGLHKPVVFTWTQPKGCAKAVVTSVSDCNELKITVTNPADGKETKVVVAVGASEKKNVTLKPGENVVVEIGRVDNLVAKVTVGDTSQDVKFVLPANCGATLPVTGTNTALVAGGALVLLGSGAGLFVVARRRRIRFTV